MSLASRAREAARVAMIRHPALVGPEDPALWTVATPIRIPEELATLTPLIEDMRRVLRETGGAGLAAPQVGVSVALFVWRGGEVAINPECSASTASPLILAREGCLTWPGRWTRVNRYERIMARWGDETGTLHEEQLEGLDARVFQHEADHLNGVCIYPRPAPVVTPLS